MAKKHLAIQNLTRNCNEILILGSLAGGRMHGYEIALSIEEKSKGHFPFNYGTLYPILHKLEKEGYIKGTWKLEGPKRKRKYYSLTARGRRYASATLEAWRDFTEQFFEITAELE